MHEHRYVILGGGVAGGYAVKELVEQGAKSGEIVLISADDRLPYERPPLSKKFLLGEKEAKDVLINDEKLYKRRSIDVHLKTEIWRIDFYKRLLYPKSGEGIAFRKLLLATGSRVRTLDVPGADLEGLFYLRWLHDAEGIREAAERGGARRRHRGRIHRYGGQRPPRPAWSRHYPARRRQSPAAPALHT